jgi:hypothetical protein
MQSKRRLTTGIRSENCVVRIYVYVPRVWTDHSIRPKQCKRGKRFGTWNVRSLFRSGSLMIAARKLAMYKLDLVGVQGIRWEKRGTVRSRDYNFFMETEMKIIN